MSTVLPELETGVDQDDAVVAPSHGGACSAASRVLPRPETTVKPSQVRWRYAVGIPLVHVLACLAFLPYFFSWTGVAVAIAGLYVFGTLGINLCYHRILTHQGMVAPKWLEHSLAIGWPTGGSLAAGVQFGLSLMVWGVFVRTVLTWHITWSVNSVTHVWGYRNYETDDNSRNNILVGLWSNGEGWHNNHHADQRAAAHGHKWWEFDVTWITIRALETVGLVKNVVRPRAWTKGQAS